ncbi:MAG TPA: hypothetical protein VKV40_18765 [Ktedonobacteraceae bacterium]|nr:hypothetical protein [Ktedonobacteraceae bacterium]
MKQFQSIEKLDTAILYILELASSLSVLLLAFGLIASMANVLTKGSVLTDNLIMQRIWAWTQCIAIDAGLAGTILRAVEYHSKGEAVKTWLYVILSVLLLFTAAIVSNIEAVQQTLNISLDVAYSHVFIPVELLIWIRSIAIVLLIVAHAARHAQIGNAGEQPEPVQQQPVQFEITPDLINALTVALSGVQVIEEAPETKQIAERGEETRPLECALQELEKLLPDVSLPEITAVVTAYRANVPRREMCSYLKWGGVKYTTIVKPVLDTYEQLQQEM